MVSIITLLAAAALLGSLSPITASAEAYSAGELQLSSYVYRLVWADERTRWLVVG